ncbi:hypothetical protein ASG31_15035 [Chryseobacterium sp. Leaf404]|nr:hypothetical protein ASG31_15035 [Chryseobacterium sp. Leaf404]
MVLRKRESRSPPVFIQILNHLFDWGFFCFGAGCQMRDTRLGCEMRGCGVRNSMFNIQYSGFKIGDGVEAKVAGCRVRVSDDRGLGDDFNV